MSGDHNIYQKTTGIHEQQFFAKEAQSVREPVAWADMDVRGEDKGLSWTPGHFHKTPLYTSPPASKPWVGLTDEAVWNLYKNLWMFHPAEEPRLAGDILKFARAIEAKLREKNQKENPGVL